jgi:hypothetical protein
MRTAVHTGVAATEPLEPCRRRRRRRPVGPRREHHLRAGPSTNLRAEAGLSRSKWRRPMVGLPRRGHHPRAREGGTSPNPPAVPTGARRRRRSPSRGLYLNRRRPSRRRHSSGPSGRRLPRRAALKKRRRVGSRSAPKANGCLPEHLAATGLPNRATTPALGPGMTPRPAIALRSVLPTSVNPRRCRLRGGAGIPAPPSRPARSANPRPAGANRGGARGPVIPRTTPTPTSADPRRRLRRCRRHPRQCHPRRRRQPTGSRRCRRPPRPRPGIAPPTRWTPTRRHRVASRSPSCWRGCKPARPAAAGAGAAGDEEKDTTRFGPLPG